MELKYYNLFSKDAVINKLPTEEMKQKNKIGQKL